MHLCRQVVQLNLDFWVAVVVLAFLGTVSTVGAYLGAVVQNQLLLGRTKCLRRNVRFQANVLYALGIEAGHWKVGISTDKGALKRIQVFRVQIVA